MIFKYRFFQSVILIALLLFLNANVSDIGNVSYDPLPTEDDTVYSIGICSPMPTETTAIIEQGFTDALSDSLGASHFELTYARFNDSSDSETAPDKLISESVDLIFTEGTEALSAASLATLSVPIIATNVISIKDALHIPDNTYDGMSGRNITGISSMPNISSQLSALLEIDSHINSVGLLYSSKDSEAILQNSIMEQYLDQAGIPWKEYEINLSEAQEREIETEASLAPSVVKPQHFYARSAKEGANIDIEPIGANSLLNGIIAPEGIRSAKISKNWIQSKFDDGIPENPSTVSDAVELACKECDSLYISSGSMLFDQLSEISEITTKYQIPTLGGDISIGEYTLVSTFIDPYDQGYRAGKMAYRILVNNTSPSQIKIGDSSSATYLKLYQHTIAKDLEMEFPKSYRRVYDIQRFYVNGSMTQRIVQSE